MSFHVKARKPAKSTSTSVIPKAILQQARKNGILNLPNRGLKEIPAVVWELCSITKSEHVSFDSNEKWWDQVELTKFNFASNDLQHLPEDIRIFKCLKVLDVHDNALTSLPQSLSELTQLEKLDVSHNQLSVLPSLGQCEQLLVLHLQHNRLSALFPSLEGIAKCEKLDASHNLLQCLPTLAALMPNLKYLALQENQLSHMDCGKLMHLKFLDISSNQFKTLPSSFGVLTSLEQLNLRNNQIQTIPNLSHCSYLKELYLGSNKLQDISIELPTSLSILELRDNQISCVPNQITKVESLERLDLGNNNISNLPPEMGLMQQLKVVVLEGNPLRSIRRDVIMKGTHSVLQYLRSRIVPTSDASEISQGKGVLPQSQVGFELSLRNDVLNSGKLHLKEQDAESIQKILDEFSDLKLSDVRISQCPLTTLPTSLSSFSSTVTFLDVSSAKLKKVSVFIGKFQSLLHLNLSRNFLEDLPAEISQLKVLLEINISSNKFKSVPACIFELSRLENLLADDNQINFIPSKELMGLDVLATLSLKNNCIAHVPPELGLLKSLRSIGLEGNTFKIPRQSILQRGSAAVLEYLRSRVSC